MKNKNRTRGYSKSGGKVGNMFGFPLFGRDKARLLSVIESDIEKKKKIWLATVNPEFVMATRKDKKFLEILQSRTTYNVIDGIGLIWAEKLQTSHHSGQANFKLQKIILGFKVGLEILAGKHKENLITGADLMDDLCKMAERNGQTVYFYGGWTDRSEKTAKYFLKKYPKLKVVGFRAEDFDFKTKVDYLFVARAMKKQELWIDDNFEKLKVSLVMGVGRSFDYYSGALKRAPRWVQKMGMEWLFSLIMEPKRWKRQLELPKFIWMVLKNPLKI